MADLAKLTGRVTLHVGNGLPAIDSSRTEWAPQLAAGRPAEALPTLLGALFTLCAPAHRLCAAAAVQAARGAAVEPRPAERDTLRLATLRDQIQRITHDWPRQLLQHPDDPQSTARLLRSCPLWHDSLTPPQRIAALPEWLTRQWLGLTPERWLAAHDADPQHFAAAWAQRQQGDSRLAALLHHLLQQPVSPLDLTLDDDTLRLDDTAIAALARPMAQVPGFCLQPVGDGRPRSTGPWSRRADAPGPATAWHRLIARVVDVLRLALPDGAQRLALGATTLSQGHGVAWCEMSRGLLVHAVQLTTEGERIAACRVLAPTEWNFHPSGGLARALATLDDRHTPDARHAAARCLAVAFDPCVDFELRLPHTAALQQREVPHHA